jgi:hypothetical protein
MFGFIFDMGNHEDRVVANYKQVGLIVDTARVSDGAHPFETGVSHPKYKHGDWVIVEAYDSQEAAQIGHAKWVKIMTAEELPSSLTECGNSLISNVRIELGDPPIFPKEQ